MTRDIHFTGALEATDPLIADALRGERKRQQSQIELIASENMASRAVLDALGHEISNKTLEGYPGNRFHGGADYADIVENAVIDRARELFGCEYVNAQPHSGTQANQAVFFATLRPGERTLSLDLAAGGHLSHGARPNLSGRWFDAHHYQVSKETGLIDYDEVEQRAREVSPRLIIAGGSAYPRELDFARMRAVADQVEAILLVDMAHFAGLVAAGVHPSPIPYADIVTCTTTKTMRGPRGGLILSRSDEWRAKLQSAIFPGVQGSLHTQVIAAKAVCLGEALRPAFKRYGARVKANASQLAETLSARGIKVISGGTDTHLILLDFSPMAVRGQQVQDVLYSAGITSNKNPIPFDSPKPSEWVGLRLGTSAATTRGFDRREFEQIGNIIADLAGTLIGKGGKSVIEAARKEVADLCRRYPVYH